MLLTQSAPPPGRRCQVVARPAALPPASRLVDSVALERALLQRWRDAALPPGFALLSLAFDRNGYNVRRRVVEHRLAPTVADSVQKLVFAYRRSTEPDAEWGVRLRLDVSADSVRMRVGRQERCEARLLDLHEPDGTLPLFVETPTSALTRSAPAPATATVPASVMLQLDARGAVVGVRLEAGPLDAARERRLLDFLRSLSFEPALEDGLPAPDSLRLRLRLPAR